MLFKKQQAEGAAGTLECLNLMSQAQYNGRKDVFLTSAILSVVTDNRHCLTGGHLACRKMSNSQLYMESALTTEISS